MNVTSTKDAEQSLGCQYCNAVILLTRAGATALYMYCTYCTKTELSTISTMLWPEVDENISVLAL